MSTIRTAIELEDNFTGILYNIVNAVNMTVSVMEQMQTTMNTQVDPSTLDGVRDYANQATIAVQELNAALQDVEPSEPVEVPIHWQSDTMDVFTNSGVERFEQEVLSANNMLNTLNQTQTQIAETAAQISIFPPNMVTDMNSMQARLQAIQQRIQTIENNPLNMGTDVANAELEQLRGQLDLAVHEQEMLNQAVENMNVQAANQAYLRLSQTVDNTERYIRDNVTEQGRFNREIQEGVDYAGQLNGMIASAVGAFVGVAGIKKAFGFVEDCTQAFNTQLNAETQLISVLANMLDEEYVAQFEVDIAADTTAAIDDINAIQAGVDEIVVPVMAETRALTAAFDQIKAKASEIQSRGIYGDETMIAAAAEFSTYFTDTDAIEMMMDTLSDYAMGMSGGGEIGSQEMVNYATNLGKIMTGAYDAMTKKGFELSDIQKAIIEGTATQEQIVYALGEEYLTMSQDMQAAAAISQVVEESWAGLYESMSNTPEGKIIQMANAWGDMKEVIGGQLYPYVLLFVDTINENWPTIEIVISGITTWIERLLGMLSWVLDAAIFVADAIIENWSWISPIIYGIVWALAAYRVAQFIANAINLASRRNHILMAGAQTAHAIATGALTTATEAEAFAQEGLNTAMYACPIVWIIVLIFALIAALILLWDNCEGFRHFMVDMWANQAKALGQFYNSTVVPVGNGIISVQNEIVDSLRNSCINIVNLIADMAISAVNNISCLTDTMRNMIGLYNQIAGVFGGTQINADFVLSEQGIEAMREEALSNIESITASMTVSKLPELDLEKFNSLVDSYADAARDFRVSDFINGMLSDLFGNIDDQPFNPEDYISDYRDLLDRIGNGVDDIAENTGTMDVTAEELKYLRDIAEQDAINRFTTAEIRIEQTNHNTIKNGMDLDGIMSGMTDMVNEAIDIATEGVHD